jgi:hypothetical protein
MRHALTTLLLLAAVAGRASAWGDRGHELVNEAAAKALPESAPALLLVSVARLTYLGPEPDRWRLSALEAMARGLAPDHYVDLEWCTGIDPASPPPNRHEYAKRLVANGQSPDKVGFAPYTVVELCQRIEAAIVAYELVDPAHPHAAERRRQAEENLLHVAGVLGHYVADLANPHHTTIHYNGWAGDDNPEGFATDRGVHARFESDFVDRLGARLTVPALPAARDDLDYVRAVWDHVLESNGLVRDLYRLDKRGAFAEGNEDTAVGVEGREFVARRMLRGATLLRDLWTTACARGRVRAAAEKLRLVVSERLEPLGQRIWVDVSLERVVSLRGLVDGPDLARQAIELAKATPGVARVAPRLAVRY